MDFEQVRNHVESECTFPLEHEALLEEVGDFDLELPQGGTTKVSTVLDRANESTYHSPNEVLQTLKGTVGDEAIGRKHYDDRGGARQTPNDRTTESM